MKSLKKIWKQSNPHDEMTDSKFLHDYDNIIKTVMKEKALTSKKNKITAILTALGSETPKDQLLIDRYSKKIKELANEYNSFLISQQKTESQAANWLTFEQVQEVFASILKDVRFQKINRKKVITDKQFQLLQELIVLQVYLAIPIRNDFADMKVLKPKEYAEISQDEKDENNFLILGPGNRKTFLINQFKNVKSLGQQSIKVDSVLSRALNIWLRHNKSGWFLVRSDKKTPLNPNNLSKLVTKIFKDRTSKNVGISMLRHIIVSKNYEGEKSLLEKKELARKLLHSTHQEEVYRKIGT